MVSESRLAYISAFELPSKVCESFTGTNNGEDIHSSLQDSTKDYDVKNSESGNNGMDKLLSESDSSLGSSSEAHSESDPSSETNNEAYSESDSSSGSNNGAHSQSDSGQSKEVHSESNSDGAQNKTTNNDIRNDLTNFANNDKSGNSNEENDNENSEGTQNKITIQNYGYKNEAVLKSTACSKVKEPFNKILLLCFSLIIKRNI